MRVGQVVAGSEVAEAGDGQDLEACRRRHGRPVARAPMPVMGRPAGRPGSRRLTIWAVAAGRVISRGVARTGYPRHVGGVGLVDQPGVEQAASAVCGRRSAGRRLGRGPDADRRQAVVGHAAQRLSADDRRVADDRGGGRAQRRADTGHGQDGADRRPPGWTVPAGSRRRRRWPTTASVWRLLFRRRRSTNAVGWHLRAVANPPLLEVNCATGVVGRIGDHHVGFAPVVAGGQQPRIRLPAVAQRRGDLRERVAGVQHLGAHQMGGEVPVAEWNQSARTP